MKLKSTILDFLSSTAARQPRTDVIQFLRRYVVPNRNVTHYRAYGAQARNVKSFVDKLGLVEKTDYEIIRSEYDPETIQFRWNDTHNVNDFVRLITSVPVSSFDTFAADAITGNLDVKKYADRIFTDDAEAFRADEIADAEYPLPDFRARNIELRSELSEAVDCDESIGESQSILSIIDRSFNGGWVILPPSIVESIVLSNPDRERKLFELFGDSKYPNNGVFQKTSFNLGTTGVRFLKKGERLVGYGRMFDSPFSDLMRDNSPMVGYLATNNCMVDMTDQKGKDFAFMRTDDYLDTSVHAVSSVLKDQGKFWKYVRCLYEVAYGIDAFVSPLSRLTFPNSLIGEMNKTLGSTEPHMSCAFTIGIENIESPFLPERFESLGVSLGIFLGRGAHDMLDQTPDLEKSCEYGPVIVHELPDSETSNAFTETNMDVSDLPYEWFEMFHEKNVQDAYADSNIRLGNLRAFRNREATITPEKAAWLSAFIDSNPIAKNNEGRYSPASAFVYSVIAAIRTRCGSDEAPIVNAEPGTYAPCYSYLHSADDSIVTAVYTGITTDKSCIDDTETFPLLGGTVANPCSMFPDEYRKSFTKAINTIAEKGLQYKMAKRSAGVPRTHTVVIETNVDAQKFFDSATDVETMRYDIATSFLRTLCGRISDPLTSIEESTRQGDGIGPYMREVLKKAVERDEVGWRPLDNRRVILRFSQIYGDSSSYEYPNLWYLGNDRMLYDEGVEVRYGVDVSGRLFVIVTITGNAVTHARYAYRLENALPIKSASLRRRTETPSKSIKTMDLSDGSIYIAPEFCRDTSAIYRIISWHVNHGKSFETGHGVLPTTRHTFGPQLRGPRIVYSTSGACPREYFIDA